MLTWHETLARQMEREGQQLGVPVVRFAGTGDSIPLPNDDGIDERTRLRS